VIDTIQLDRILHSQGFGTRRACRGLVRAGAVTVGGAACADPFAEFDPRGFEFVLNGEPWRYREKAYVLINKPSDYECSRSPRHHPSVLDLLPAALALRGVQPVGRLDEDTTGLLLLSDDGAFIHALTSPRRKIVKRYEVTLKHPAGEGFCRVLSGGVVLHDDPSPVAAIACVQTDERTIRLDIDEGRYHQVKRMVGAAGNRVEALRRIAIGRLELPPELPPGDWRWLEPVDLELVYA